MPASSSFTHIETSDADFAQAPYRISDKSGYSSAMADVRLIAPEGGLFRAWRLVAGANRNAKKLDGAGMVCGLDICGTIDSRSLALPAPAPNGWATGTGIDYYQLAGPDRDVEISVFALHETEGWV